ncbi:MAG: tRNA (adenosine(37)-N6)-threonylcarbamoyltransferase complex transferase subunit TsaD [Candidatus Paceibacterota bacterium]
MKILGIETSCDETAICILHASEKNDRVTILGNALYSQIAKHKEFGGVFPMLAKREHTKNLVPILEQAMREAGMISPPSLKKASAGEEILKILERENDLGTDLLKFAEKIERPDIDAIAVTHGPGLEPALWVGVSFAKALSALWNIPVYPTNHMEGHILVASLSPFPSLIKEGCHSEDGVVEKLSYEIKEIKYPAIALLISGGHTQLVLVKSSLDYEIVGNTRDDAVGEAGDKVARLLGLPYPGGPEIARYAEAWIQGGKKNERFKFPRPMIHSPDLDFSFSGLKTAVLYTVQKIPEMTEEIKQEIAFAFKEAVVDVLVSKTRMALEKYGAQTLIVGGGVIADKVIREALRQLAQEKQVDFCLPEISASTDNALMIALAGYINLKNGQNAETEFKANGNLSL